MFARSFRTPLDVPPDSRPPKRPAMPSLLVRGTATDETKPKRKQKLESNRSQSPSSNPTEPRKKGFPLRWATPHLRPPPHPPAHDKHSLRVDTLGDRTSASLAKQKKPHVRFPDSDASFLD